MKKALIPLFFIAIIVSGFFYRGFFIEWSHKGGFISVLVSVLFISFLVFFPLMPFVVAAGIIGSMFGTWMGASICLCGSLLGTLTMFLMARYGFRDWVQKQLEKHQKLKKYETVFEKNSFLGVLILRLIPIVPAPVLNILCATSYVHWLIFVLATLMGKAPGILILTFAGGTLGQNKPLSLLIYTIYFLIIAISMVYIKMKTKVTSVT